MVDKYVSPGQDSVRVIEVVETTLTCRGAGKDDSDPARIITQYWSKDGKLLAERDHWKEEHVPTNLVDA